VPATIVQFPIARQDDVIAKIAAAAMRKRSATAADRCIGQAMRQLAHDMRSRGIPPVTVKREIHAMEALIRGAIWRLMFPWSTTERIRARRQRREIRHHPRAATPGDQLVFSWIGDGE
jgi:hypothetical protein